ncbi:hypothetical protein SAMD00019534_046520, partial [Acytostelium subglobosum LB1]|uniref:hypothetical protein n=1 Tax=Acytostelium subglobosum LB1 TaxID=1410327 RepID=UPI00064496B1
MSLLLLLLFIVISHSTTYVVAKEQETNEGSGSNATTASSSGNVEPIPSSVSTDFALFTFKHFLIILVVFGAFLALSIIMVQLRIKLKNIMIDRIPRKIMPFLRPGDLSHKQRTIILNELVRSKQLVVKPSIGESPISHLGWGSPGSEYSKVHFKTSIAKSWIILERAAVHFNADLKRQAKMCMRDYVNMLLDRCPHMNRSLARFYVDAYEKARFSEQEFTLDEYTHFMTKFLVLLQDFEGSSKLMMSSPLSHQVVTSQA